MYVMDFGYILLGFGNATSYSFGFSLLRGDSRDVLHRKRDQLLSYQVFVTYIPTGFLGCTHDVVGIRLCTRANCMRVHAAALSMMTSH